MENADQLPLPTLAYGTSQPKRRLSRRKIVVIALLGVNFVCLAVAGVSGLLGYEEYFTSASASRSVNAGSQNTFASLRATELSELNLTVGVHTAEGSRIEQATAEAIQDSMQGGTFGNGTVNIELSMTVQDLGGWPLHRKRHAVFSATFDVQVVVGQSQIKNHGTIAGSVDVKFDGVVSPASVRAEIARRIATEIYNGLMH